MLRNGSLPVLSYWWLILILHCQREKMKRCLNFDFYDVMMGYD